MSLRHHVAVVLFFLVAFLPFTSFAQQAPAAGGTVHGMVVDPDDALIPGATATVTSGSGKSVSATSKSDGTYTIRGVATGTYTLTVSAPGFATYSKQSIAVTAGANIAADVKMALQDQTQTVNVTTDTVQLSVDPENNQSSTVITGDALNALSDDPDELQTELQALAGPSAGPNGGQIYIDGFTGGQLPPKSSILAIRINSNPFSAQYDQLGYGRIEIITKPGTDKFHGSGSFQYQDKAFNTSTPFLGAANSQPDYHTIFGMGNVTGPIRTGMSFTLGGSYRDIDNNNIINPTAIYASSPTSTVMCAPAAPGCTSYPYPTIARAAPAPQTRWDINPRLDTMIGSKNTLTTRFAYEHNTITSNGSGNSLPALGNTATSSEITVQLSDTQLISDKIINEARFEYQRDNSNTDYFNTSPEVEVQGIVNANGSGGGSIYNTISGHWELQNYTSIQLLKNFVRLGGRLRTTGETISSNTDNNGTLLYSYLLDPCTDPTITNKPSSCAAAGVSDPTPCAYLTPSNNSNNVQVPSSYQCGVPFEFTDTVINKLAIGARQTDGEFYAEDDWKATPNFTWSYGVRLETQNYIDSTHDFAPRTSLAWGIPRKNGKTTTVLRAGFGIFYNRFGLSSIANIIQNNPANQDNFIYKYPVAACTPTNITACTSGTLSGGLSTVPIASPGLRSAYVMQSAATVEQQVGKYTSLSVTYLNARGEHQFLTRTFPSTNNPCPTTISSAFYLQCNQSEGVFRQNQINTNINVRTPKGTSIFGYYSANWADSNLSGITDPYSSSVDYGRASFAIRSRMVMGGTVPLPFLITASPLIFAQSGTPYNVTTGIPDAVTELLTDRPLLAGSSLHGESSCYSTANFNNSTPYSAGSSLTEIPVNYCTGPANVSLNLRLSRTFGFGPKIASTRGGAQGGPGGGPGGFGGAFGRGGGRGGRDGGGGGGRNGTNTGRKYNLTIGAQAFNLFNMVPYATQVSTLSSTLFGKSTALAGSQFSGANDVRRITLQANFYF
jgi:hypothetical protein